jgi:hypothetical protein
MSPNFIIWSLESSQHQQPQQQATQKQFTPTPKTTTPSTKQQDVLLASKISGIGQLGWTQNNNGQG